MEGEETDIPTFRDPQMALGSGGPFHMFPHHYRRINLKDIPKDKWYLFQDMVLREHQVNWRICNEDDIHFVSNVLRENPSDVSLCFPVLVDSVLIGQLAEIMQSSTIQNLCVENNEYSTASENDLSVIFRAVRHMNLLETLKIDIQIRTLSECEALACALQNPRLKNFSTFFREDPPPEFWSIISPSLMHSLSIRECKLQISNQDCAHLNKILTHNEIITKFILRLTGDLSAEAMADMISGLKHNSSLKYLCLTFKTEGEFIELCKAFAHDQIKLQTFQIRTGYALAENTMNSLGQSLRTNSSLTAIDFWASTTKCQVLAESLKYNTTLKSLRIVLKQTDIEGFNALCDSLKSNTSSLTYLDLSNTPLNNQHFEMIGHILHHNKSLKSLILNSVNLDDIGLKFICDALTKNNSLTELSIGNQTSVLYGINGLKCVINMLDVNNTITRLDVSCHTVDERFEMMCNALQNNRNIRHFGLGTYFHGDLKECDLRLSKLLENNCTITSVTPVVRGRMTAFIRRNRRLWSEAQFTVAILSRNIARDHHALEALPRELWTKILLYLLYPCNYQP